MTSRRRHGPRTPLGAWIMSMLRSRGWRQSDLAERMGIDQSMVSKWVRGARNPDGPHCEGLAAAFGVPAEEVLALAGRIPVRTVPHRHDHPTRGKIIALVETFPDPDALDPFLLILERYRALLDAETPA